MRFYEAPIAAEPGVDDFARAPEASDSPSHHTETNTQVDGVDEPDFVKTDGHRIFVIHGRELEVFASWPAEETAHLGAVEIEGDPVSMFLAGDRLVVFSQVYFTDEAGDAGTPRPESLAPSHATWGLAYPYAYRAFTKMSVLDVSEEQPELLHERYVEGHFRDARRHDDVVRTLVRAPTWDPVWSSAVPSGWTEDGMLDQRAFRRQIDTWLEERLEEIASRELSGFLPDEYVVGEAGLLPVSPRCDRYYAPEPGQSAYGMTVALTTDISTGDDESLFVLGDPSHIYASHDALVLSHVQWGWGWTWTAPPATVLHAFSIEGAETAYSGSGIVDGFINNQFSIDEREGVIRVALTEWDTTSVNRVVTLEAREGELVELGRTPDLAPDETIFSARFVGEKAYVVTFRQVDPLFVVDLSDPTQPTVLGELKIPGFSTYMHPLSETHLLTIGRYVDEATGADHGMQLQIFDVSDPARPTQLHSRIIDGYSSAQQDHKAFVYDSVSEILAVPIDSWGTSFVSALRLFEVSLDEGFVDAGSIDHSPLFEECVEDDGSGFHYACGYGSSMRRGLFIDRYVYALSYGGLSVHALDDLSAPLALEPLPAPEFYLYPFSGVGIWF